MNQESAEILALKGLAYLVNAPESFERFLALSGINGKELRARAEEPFFLAALMDFLLSEDPLLKSFCEAESIDAKNVHIARKALPG